MSKLAQLKIHQEAFAFSAGHFTIFSATERETLHGHNYTVSLSFQVSIKSNGLAFDYRIYKQKMKTLCRELDRHFLLPAHSPHLSLKEEGEYLIAVFNGKKIPFPKEDAIILPLVNITIEELSHYFLSQLVTQLAPSHQPDIYRIELEVFNGPEQSAKSEWCQEKLCC